MIPEYIKYKIKEVKELKVVNSVKLYNFDNKTNTLYIPVTENDFSSMFYCCSFTKIELCINNNIKHAATMFSRCSNLKEIIFTKKLNLSEVNSLFGLFNGCLSLISFDFKDIILSNKLECFTHVFNGCACLHEVNFGDNFPSEKIKNIDFAFYRCESLEKINWAECQPFNNLECIKAAFIKCSRLKELDLRGVDFNKVEELENAFYNTNSELKIFVNSTFRKEMLFYQR